MGIYAMEKERRNSKPLTARQVVLDGLNDVTKDGAYSGIVLDRMVKQGGFDRRDVGFATRLFYGVLERSVTLDYAIRSYTGKPIEKLDVPVLNILRMGLYQLKYMDAVPDSAAVNESVNLTAYAKKASAKGMVNAILRRFIREEKKLPMPDAKKDPLGALAVETACPKWILSLWKKQYGLQKAKETAAAMLSAPPVTIRVNPLITEPAALSEQLTAEGFAVKPVNGLPMALDIVDTAKSLDTLSAYKTGAFYVQDAASQWCVKTLNAKKGERILDLCAAPGGKSIGAAMDMENVGEIAAFDLFAHKVKLIEDNAKRLGLSCIHAAIGDAAIYREGLGEFDKVLCDVPCSGLGVMRRKPEIRTKSKESVEKLPELQLKILTQAAKYVKNGGTLLYSTCTINQQENKAVVEKFLSTHPEFIAVQTDVPGVKDAVGATLFPQDNNTDGFYIAKLMRKSGT